jgi:hypothetical protein
MAWATHAFYSVSFNCTCILQYLLNTEQEEESESGENAGEALSP